jgi:putative transposase
MTNHVHLLLTPPSVDNCIALMRNLGQRYVQYFNKRYERTGTLWEGRFRSCVVESSRYVLACYRYVEMNPVRAGIARTPGEYVWSSHLGNTREREDHLLSPHIEIEALGWDGDSRVQAYRALFQSTLPEGELRAIRDSTNGGYPLVETAMSGVSPSRLKRGRAGRPAKDREVPDDGQLEIGL